MQFCFCDFHRQAARERGIDFERTRQGYLALDRFIRETKRALAGADGVILSRKHSETNLANLSAAGRAVRTRF